MSALATEEVDASDFIHFLSKRNKLIISQLQHIAEYSHRKSERVRFDW